MSAPAQIGAYVGGLAPGNEQEFHNMEQWLGHKLDFALVYFGQNNWHDFDFSVTQSLQQWPNHEPLLFSVPLTVNGSSLHDVATGEYNAHFVSAAMQIAAYDPNATVRIGWEANGSWFPWSGASNPQDYIDAFRDVVDIFRAVDPHFKFDWTVNIGTQAVDPAKIYPGDAWVNYIGMDMNIYHTDYPAINPTEQQVWDRVVTEPGGLNWLADFAAQHNKPITLPEYGADFHDGVFVNHMADWIKGHNVAYQAWWNSENNFPSSLESHPADQQAFIAQWGGQSDYWHVS